MNKKTYRDLGATIKILKWHTDENGTMVIDECEFIDTSFYQNPKEVAIIDTLS